MAENNFLQWAPGGAVGQENDATYAGDSQRVNGGVDGEFWLAALANKYLYQQSTMASAIAYMMQLKGYSCLDGSSPVTAAGTPSAGVIALAAVLANLITPSDLRQYANTTPVSVTNPTSSTVLSLTLPSVPVGAGQIIRVSGGIHCTAGSTGAPFLMELNGLVLFSNSITIGQQVGDSIKFVSEIALNSSSSNIYSLASGIGNGSSFYSPFSANAGGATTVLTSASIQTTGGHGTFSADYICVEILPVAL
jgi:hypothetical protein